MQFVVLIADVMEKFLPVVRNHWLAVSVQAKETLKFFSIFVLYDWFLQWLFSFFLNVLKTFFDGFFHGDFPCAVCSLCRFNIIFHFGGAL